jgi:hypothetical protein
LALVVCAVELVLVWRPCRLCWPSLSVSSPPLLWSCCSAMDGHDFLEKVRPVFLVCCTILCWMCEDWLM